MSTELWVGILVGVLVGAFAPGWAKLLLFLGALLFSDLALNAVHGAHNVHSVYNIHSRVPPWFIGVAGVAFALWALHYARKRGLQHLGEAELRTRWTAVRGISRWGW